MGMNFNAVNVVMFGIGAVLVYCAIKDKSPKEVVLDAFTQGSSAPHAGKTSPANGSGKRHPHEPGSATPSHHAPVTSN